MEDGDILEPGQGRQAPLDEQAAVSAAGPRIFRADAEDSHFDLDEMAEAER